LPRFKGFWWAFNEVKICLILANRERIGHIFYTKRNEAIYGFFPRAEKNREKIGARIGLISLILSTGDSKRGIAGDLPSGEKKTGKITST
jgi:hypothetical protein